MTQYYRVLSAYAYPGSEVSSEFACPYSTETETGAKHKWSGWKTGKGSWSGSTNFELEQIGKIFHLFVLSLDIK